MHFFSSRGDLEIMKSKRNPDHFFAVPHRAVFYPYGMISEVFPTSAGVGFG